MKCKFWTHTTHDINMKKKLKITFWCWKIPKLPNRLGKQWTQRLGVLWKIQGICGIMILKDQTSIFEIIESKVGEIPSLRKYWDKTKLKILSGSAFRPFVAWIIHPAADYPYVLDKRLPLAGWSGSSLANQLAKQQAVQVASFYHIMSFEVWLSVMG